ncbi:lysophospholipid acyltransferase family protein [Algoriphagus vanfongensis]|uniref:lysophospholipid acyltransferase family protein n=1 Tax=Algoriphagus vanfongensis TaxID=426371 RepID=UPI0004281C17|nr:lysophospholipid acyltransferase family protein [Algoriphagus vanfongensis]
MNKIFLRIYSIYAGLVFLLSFILIFPFFLVCIWVSSWKRFGRKINRYWARIYFSLIFLPVKREIRGKIEKGKPYLFLANHFSYLDIPMMGFIPGDVQFVGKASIRKVPLFGYYFKGLHIAVDRSRLRSRAETMRRAGEALDQGSSIVLFPEGGIYSQSPPEMIAFKNGAFRLALEKQIPIIPVTLSYNHLILPDDGKLLLHPKPAKMVLHEALIPQENETEKSLKDRCFSIIQQQLEQDNSTR